jgi:hypothetical protein
MNVIATTLATEPRSNEPREGVLVKVLRKITPPANPDLEALYPAVRLWWIELDDYGTPQREIGFDSSGSPVVAGPIGTNMGFWTDSHMTFAPKDHESVSPERFEGVWSRIEANPPWTGNRSGT